MKSILKCMVLICCLSFLDALKFRCDYRYTPQGWFKYQEIPAVWADARLRCQLEGGMLASPTTPEIKSTMMESFCKPEIFTGLHATFSKGYYTSIDGIPLNQIQYEWAAFEPDNKNDSERCIALHSDGNIADVRCDEPRPYICFRPPSAIDVNVCGTPDPEYDLYEGTNKCYKLHTNPRQFERANFACTAEGGHLAIINSEDEFNYLANFYTNFPLWKMLPGNYYKDYAYVGLHSWEESIDWSTIHGQSLQEVGYTLWHSGQPDSTNKHQSCGSLLRSDYMYDGECDLHMVFICEKRPDFPPVCDTVTAQNKNKYKRSCDKDVKEKKRIDSRSSEPVPDAV